MAEGNPPTQKKRLTAEDERLRKHFEKRASQEAIKERTIKVLFSSPQWYYPVHKYIGDIVQDNKFSVHYQPEHKWICFQWYCDLVSEFMIHLVDWKRIAAAVLKVLPNDKNLVKGLPSDEVALISEKDAIYILGTYNFECFDFLLRTFAIEMKESCLDFVKKQLGEMIETNQFSKHLMKEEVGEFVSRQWNKLIEQKREAVERIEKICANEYFSGIECISPLSFILLEEIDPQEMPPAPISPDPKHWMEYFLQVCSARLTSTLAKEKAQWDAGFPLSYGFLQSSIIDKFTTLTDILKNPGVPPKKRLVPFDGFTKRFREEVNRLISEKLH